MLNIRETLLTILDSFSITLLETNKDMTSTNVALQDTHQVVFNNSACLIGDSSSVIEPFTSGTSKTRFFIQLIVCAKSQSARENLEETVNTLVNLLHNNRLNNSFVIDSQVTSVEAAEKPAIQFVYKIINYEVLAWTSHNPACPVTNQITGVTANLISNAPGQNHSFTGVGTTPTGFGVVNYEVNWEDVSSFPSVLMTETGSLPFSNGSWTGEFAWNGPSEANNFEYTFTLTETTSGLTSPITLTLTTL